MIIDFHYHFFPSSPTEKELAGRARRTARYYGAGGRNGLPVTEAQILERLRDIDAPDPDGSGAIQRMDEAGIDLSVVVALDWFGVIPEQEVLSVNRACADWVKNHSGRMIAFASVDPRRKNAPELVRRCVEDYGMRGLKWHPDQGFYPNSPEAYAVLEVAQELKIPLLTHTGPLPPAWHSKFAYPGFLDDVCLDFRYLKVIAAHMGQSNWADWAGLAQVRHNLFGDLAMWQYVALGNYPRFCRLLRDIIDWSGIEAVLFGTDSPDIEAIVTNRQFIQAIRDLPAKAPPGIAFTDAEVEAILSGNAKKLLFR